MKENQRNIFSNLNIIETCKATLKRINDLTLLKDFLKELKKYFKVLKSKKVQEFWDEAAKRILGNVASVDLLTLYREIETNTTRYTIISVAIILINTFTEQELMEKFKKLDVKNIKNFLYDTVAIAVSSTSDETLEQLFKKDEIKSPEQLVKNTAQTIMKLFAITETQKNIGQTIKNLENKNTGHILDKMRNGIKQSDK